MTIAKYDAQRVLVDSGNLVNILFYDTFILMNLLKNQLRWISIPLVGFSGDSIGVEGKINLPSL